MPGFWGVVGTTLEKAFNMACRIMKSRDDAEDVMQDAWMKAYGWHKLVSRLV